MDSRPPLFDPPSALERLEGDEELLREIVSIFLDDAPRLFLSLKQARVDRDRKAAERHAHSLKGASANVGALALQKLSLDAETCSRDDAWDNLEILIPELETTLHATLEEMRRWLE